MPSLSSGSPNAFTLWPAEKARDVSSLESSFLVAHRSINLQHCECPQRSQNA